MLRFRVENFFFSQYPKIFVGKPLVLQELCRSEKIYEKEGERRGGEGYQDFPSKKLCLRVPENFVGESVSVSLVLVV